MVKFSGGKAAATLLLAAAILAPPATMGYMDFEHMSTPELEDILGALEEEAAAGDYRDDVEPSGGDDYLQDYYRGTEEGSPDYDYNLNEELQPEDDYFLPEDLSIQQRQQEDFSHGTPIASGVPAYISATGGSTAKANPPKNSGAVLPAYCDPPNPCPIGYTAKDGCISLEEFENTSEFSREFQSRQNCLCDSEHMFNCPAESEDKAPAAQNPAFLAGMPPSLDSHLPAGVGAKLVAKKGVGL